jgi:hypothetical protein
MAVPLNDAGLKAYHTARTDSLSTDSCCSSSSTSAPPLSIVDRFISLLEPSTAGVPRGVVQFRLVSPPTPKPSKGGVGDSKDNSSSSSSSSKGRPPKRQ